MIERFGSLGALLAASPETLCNAIDRTAVVELLLAARSTILRALEQDAFDGPILDCGPALTKYLTAIMAHEPRELVRILFLDGELRLIRDEIVSVGSIRNAPAYPREIFRRCFELHAASIILVHNHPTGNPAPSDQDIAFTRRLTGLAAQLDVTVQDHIIIGRRGWISFRALGLMAGHDGES